MFKKQVFVLLTILCMIFVVIGCTPKAEPVAIGIEVTPLSQTEYEIGSTIDFSSLVVKAILDDGNEIVLLSKDYTITGYNKNLLGEQTITITYGTFSKTFNIQVIPNQQNVEAFDTFLNELFVRYLQGDAFSINYLLLHPKEFGLDTESASLPRITQDDFLGMMEDASDDLDSLYMFEFNQLSPKQQLTYKILESTLKATLDFEDYYYLANGFLGSYLGYQAQLPILLAEYRFDDTSDIDHYFEMISDIPDAFENYFLYEVERSALGFGMADFVINKVIEQCNNMLASQSNPYLIANFNTKVDGLDFLTETMKQNYKEQHNTLIETAFFGGYQYLKDNLPQLKGNQTHNGGLYYLEGGREYYQALFQDATGVVIDVPDAFSYLEAKANLFYQEYSTLSANQAIIQEYFALRFSTLSGSAIVDFHKNQMDGIYPAISNPVNFQIKQVDSSMQDNFSPAAYFLSPIDAFVTETMYLNPKYTNNANYIYMTLAHEGYPGHLYQHVYFKSEVDAPYIRHILNFSGYTEGWATYVEHKSLGYAAGTTRAKNLYLAEARFNAALTAIIDIGIHYYGWKVEDIGTYLNTKYGFGTTGYQALYEQLVEIPTNVQEYYYSYFTILDMYLDAVAKLGNKFNELEFHKVILDTGPAPFAIVQEQMNKYIAFKLAS